MRNYKQYWKDGLDGRGSVPSREDLFQLHSVPDWLWDPSNLLYSRYNALSLEVKWPKREANHSTPYSAEVKNGGAGIPLPHMSSWYSA
jgi:hypothetical protein